MNCRNRIVGGIAVAFGLAMVVLLVMDGRWDNHDHLKPIKSLWGGLLFIGLGAWYLFRGAKAEPWKDQRNVRSNQEGQEPQSKRNRPDLKSILTDLEGQPSFQAECQKVETEMRRKASKLEKTSDLESERKDTPNAL